MSRRVVELLGALAAVALGLLSASGPWPP